MKNIKIICTFALIIFLSGCGLSEQQWRELGDFSGQLNDALYESGYIK